MTEALRKRIAELEEAARMAIHRLELRADLCNAGQAESSGREWKRALEGAFTELRSLLSEQTETPVEETGDVEMLPCPFCGDPPSEMHTHHQKHLPKIYWCECDGYSTQADEDSADYKTAQEWNDPEWRAPAQETGDVERVARAIYSARIAGGKNYCDFDDLCTNGHNDTYEKVMADAAAALSAMRPVSVDREKLAEIRARHEAAEANWPSWVGREIHNDRAFLLSVIERGRDD